MNLWIIFVLTNIFINVWGEGTVTISSTGDMTTLTCKNDTLDDFSMSNATKYRYVHIKDCPPPASYIESLQSLKINLTTLKGIEIHLKVPDKLRNNQFDGLYLNSLTIATKNSDKDLRFMYRLDGGSTGIVDLTKGNILNVNCHLYRKDSPTTPAIWPVESVTFKKVQFYGCPPPPDGNFGDMLQSHNISVKDGEVGFSWSDKKRIRLNATLFKDLSMRKLNINSRYHNVIELSDDIFSPTLKELELKKMQAPVLPSTSQLVNVSLTEGSFQGEWGGCSKLEKLTLRRWQIPDVDHWLANCTEVRDIQLDQLSEQDVQRTLAGMGKVTRLKISRCAITIVSDELLADAHGLTHLTFSEHKLSEMHSRAFSSQSNLQTLDLSGNGLNLFWNLNDMFNSLPSLRNLSLADNPELGFCLRYYEKGEMKPPPLLQYLSLRGNRLDQLCFSDWDNLVYLDLYGNNINKLQFYDLPVPRNGTIEIDLQGNSLKHLPNTKEEHDMMIQKFSHVNITIRVGMFSDCHCRFGWFARALRSMPLLKFEGAQCAIGYPFKSTPRDHLECDNVKCAPGCYCETFWRDNSTSASCSGVGDTSLPPLNYVKNLTKLYAADMRIEKLNIQDFPETLTNVDLSGNRISNVSPDVISVLFGVPERRVALSGNLFVCNCDNQHLIAALHKFREQVTDFDKVTCVGDGAETLEVLSVDVESLCYGAQERRLLIFAAVGGVILTLTALGAVLAYRYWQEIKVFLYARGWCLCCVTEEEVDGDRQYDAFISFSHLDEEFVVEKLLPWLDSHPELRYCMHTRDWMPGEPILTHVFRSVQQSKRTIILLSRNFVKSIWGMLEFRTAHVSALREGRARVIVIVLDDVISEGIVDQELQSYLQTNTYLRWGVPRFWERLRYALPHRRLAAKPDDQSIEEAQDALGQCMMTSSEHIAGIPPPIYPDADLMENSSNGRRQRQSVELAILPASDAGQ